MNLRQIEAFRSVMISGSVTGAADSLAISQPAVSRLISDLEYSLGFSLFDRRRGHALQPTEDAAALFREVDKAFMGLDHLIKTAEDIQSLRQGRLRVIGPPFIANGILSQAAAKFLEQFTDVAVSVEARPHNEIIEMIALRQQDLGVAILPVEHSAIEVQHLRDYDAVCVVPADSSFADKKVVKLKDLENESFIANSPGSQIHHMTEQRFRDLGISPRMRINARTQEIACYLVAEGKGVAILSEPLPSHIRNFDGVLVKPISPKISFSIAFLMSSLRPPSRMVNEFIRSVETVCAE